MLYKTMMQMELLVFNEYVHLYCNSSFEKKDTGLRPIYVMFFKFLPISFQMKNNDDMWL